MKLIHLTDTHFVPVGKTLYGGDPQANLNRCIKDINHHHSDAELCVLTGDLTHWGDPESFENLKQCLTRLNLPIKLLLGNHDSRDEFVRYFPDQTLDENGFVQSAVDYAAGRFLFLDTHEPGHHDGWYCERRLTWLDQQLTLTDDRGIYLFMHHPPFEVGIPALDRISLTQKKEFKSVIEPHTSKIKHLFLGHLHRPLAGHWLGISIFSLRAINHQVCLNFDPSDRLEGNFEPPAYAVVLFKDDRLIIHTHDFMDSSENFDLRNSPVNDWATRKHPT